LVLFKITENIKFRHMSEVTLQLFSPIIQSLCGLPTRFLLSVTFAVAHLNRQSISRIYTYLSKIEHLCSTPMSISICLVEESCKLLGGSLTQRWTLPPAPHRLSIIPPSQTTLVEKHCCPLRLQHFDTIF